VHFDEQGQPAKAFPEFQAARARARDPELLATCLAGVAHSGAQIGQFAEARRALEELRAFAPAHPMLPQIEAAFKKHGLDAE
jgi:Flp pilus assembly protein TadD